MPLEKRIASAFLFENGNLAVFDVNGKQIPELQGIYSIDTHKRILLEAMDNCEFRGFEILPHGFYKSAIDWANYFRQRNMSFQEIEAI